MARFITVDVTCDWPAGCEVRVPEGDDRIVNKTLSIDGKPPREFLICKAHLEDLEAVVLPLMQAGIKVEAPAKRNGSPRSTPTPVVGTPEGNSLICKGEGCDRHGRPLHNRTGMAQHVTKAHGYENLAAYEAQHGPVVNMPKEPTTT
jgi:hypothetical protein